jgi:serine/threonine-protein kinase
MAMNRISRAALTGCWFIVRVGLLVAVAGVIAAWALTRTVDREFRHSEVTVPDVRGLSEEEATTRLQASELNLLVDSRRAVEGMDAGHVAWQDPAPGASTRRQRVVKVVLSLGPQVAQVPDVVGRSRREAQLALRALKAVVGQVISVSATQAPDVVLAQSPMAGEPLEEGQRVDLLISAGMARPAFVMPDLRGRPVHEVEGLLESVGLRIASRREELAPGPPGVVRSQSPQAGSRVMRDTGISIVVSRGAEAPVTPRSGLLEKER